MVAKRHKAFRQAALRLSAAALLRGHIFIAMNIARMIFKSFVAKLVVWQRNQSKPRLISLCDDHYNAARKKESVGGTLHV
jgi:hypothetical protein